MRQFQSVTLNVLLLLLLYYSSSDVIPLQGHKLDGKCHPSISTPIPAILHTNSSPSVLPCNLTTRKKSSQCSLHYVPFSCDLTDTDFATSTYRYHLQTHTHTIDFFPLMLCVWGRRSRPDDLQFLPKLLANLQSHTDFHKPWPWTPQLSRNEHAVTNPISTCQSK
jgi:hypothetical protein